MKRDLYLNDFGEMLEKATIREWHVEPNGFIEEDATLIAFETAKAIMEAPSPLSGRIVELHAKPGQKVDQNTVLATLELAT